MKYVLYSKGPQLYDENERLTVSEHLKLRKNYIKKALEYIEENSYTPNGDIIEIVISSLGNSQNLFISIPIKPKDSNISDCLL